MIGTHDSGTGEASRRWWHELLRPFARTQDKSLSEQFDAGARLFDLRVRKQGGGYILAHGLWESSMTLKDALAILSKKSQESGAPVYVMVTYEGKLPTLERFNFAEGAKRMVKDAGLVLEGVYIKKPVWTMLLWGGQPITVVQGFASLEWFSWRCLIPIPRFWWWVTNREVHLVESDGQTTKVVLLDFM